jgi:hypothetical protein
MLACVTACSFAPAPVQGEDVATDARGRIGDGVMPSDAHVDAPPGAQPIVVDFAVVADTTMDPTNMTSTAFGASSYLIVDGSPKGGSLFLVDLTAIPTGHIVVDAAFHVWTTTDTGAQVDLYRVLEAWNETASYLERSTGVAWSVANAGPPTSSDPGVLGSFVPAAQDTEYVTALPVAIVQAWVDTPASNFGLTIQSNNSDGARLASREAPAGRRPFVRVTYYP